MLTTATPTTPSSRSPPEISAHIDAELAQRLAERRLLIDHGGVRGFAAVHSDVRITAAAGAPTATDGALAKVSGDTQSAAADSDERDRAPALAVERTCSGDHGQAIAANAQGSGSAAPVGDAATVRCETEQSSGAVAAQVLWTGEERAMADGGASSRSMQSDADLDPPIELLNQAAFSRMHGGSRLSLRLCPLAVPSGRAAVRPRVALRFFGRIVAHG